MTMLVYSDGLEWACWALKNAEGQVLLSDICDTEREALELRRQQKIHQPHRGDLKVVSVRVQVTEVKS